MTSSEQLGSGERPFLTASWRDLVMITWAVDPAVLRPELAPGTEFDLWEGKALISIVAFDFRDTRVLGWRVPFHTRFPEVNLRFYVKRQTADGSWRRGVTFVQEMVPRRAIATVARVFYGEPYVARPMRRVAVPEAAPPLFGDGTSRSLVYEWSRHGEWERVLALLTSAPRPMRRGSIEEFIAEHYWGYTRRRGKPTMEYRVTHAPWQITLTTECLVEADLVTLFGARIGNAISGTPVSTFVAEGSPVTVYHGRPIHG